MSDWRRIESELGDACQAQGLYTRRSDGDLIAFGEPECEMPKCDASKYSLNLGKVARRLADVLAKT